MKVSFVTVVLLSLLATQALSQGADATRRIITLQDLGGRAVTLRSDSTNWRLAIEEGADATRVLASVPATAPTADHYYLWLECQYMPDARLTLHFAIERLVAVVPDTKEPHWLSPLRAWLVHFNPPHIEELGRGLVRCENPWWLTP